MFCGFVTRSYPKRNFSTVDPKVTWECLYTRCPLHKTEIKYSFTKEVEETKCIFSFLDFLYFFPPKIPLFVTFLYYHRLTPTSLSWVLFTTRIMSWTMQVLPIVTREREEEISSYLILDVLLNNLQSLKSLTLILNFYFTLHWKEWDF